MNLHLVWVVAALLSCPATGDARQTPPLAVETTAGAKLTIDHVEFSRYTEVTEGIRKKIGRDTHGNPIYEHDYGQSIFYETDVIPLRMGDGFGCQLTLPRIPDGDSLVLRVVMQLPRPVKVGGRMSDKIEGELTFDTGASGQVKGITQRFTPDEPEYYLPGTWTLLLYNKGRLLTSHRFTVKK